MPRTLEEVQAFADEHRLDALDIQRIGEAWSVALEAVGHERAYGEGPTLGDAVDEAAGRLSDG